MAAYGVYPTSDGRTAGEEISSTYEGRHITLLESDLVHPTHADGFVDKGDPVVTATGNGQIVGVAFKSATAATDKIAIDTEGIWALDVVASDDNGNDAVAGGDPIYINTSTGVLSKIRDAATQVLFGFALGTITAGNTEVIAVKVHNAVQPHHVHDDEGFYFGDARDVKAVWDGDNLIITPVADDTGAINIGNGTLDMDVKIYLGSTAIYAEFNKGQAYLNLIGVKLYAPDLATGAGEAGHVYVTPNGYLVQGD